MLAELKTLADPKRAEISRGFFKTGRGQYGEGDKFLGLTVPQCRAVAEKYSGKKLKRIEKWLNSPFHEIRLIALIILNTKFERAKEHERTQIFQFYLKNLRAVNNWDLVDLSAPNIVGGYLQDKSRKIIYQLARSGDLWSRRVAIISTLAFIRRREFTDTLKIAKILLRDSHDLIHKAVGWMLREVGKRSPEELKKFLNQNTSRMPRTALRYAIERFPEKMRQTYLVRGILQKKRM